MPCQGNRKCINPVLPQSPRNLTWPRLHRLSATSSIPCSQLLLLLNTHLSLERHPETNMHAHASPAPTQQPASLMPPRYPTQPTTPFCGASLTLRAMGTALRRLPPVPDAPPPAAAPPPAPAAPAAGLMASCRKSSLSSTLSLAPAAPAPAPAPVPLTAPAPWCASGSANGWPDGEGDMPGEALDPGLAPVAALSTSTWGIGVMPGDAYSEQQVPVSTCSTDQNILQHVQGIHSADQCTWKCQHASKHSNQSLRR